VEDSGRYGSVLSNGSLVQRFEEKRAGAGPGLINGGVYAFRRDALLRALQPRCSLERDVLPRLASENLLQGVEADGFFIDIGLPQSFAEAQRSLMAHRRRPAVFFDRDGVLNRDHGHVGSIERFEWTEGALDAIRLVNDRGYYAFVVTNQAGIAKGKYSLSDYWALRDFIRSELAANGGQIDDERFCPFHPEGIVPAYRASSPDRKPAPGMILSLIDCWPVEIEGSFLVGDQTSDLAAAEAAGIKAFHFEHGNLHDFVQGCLGEQRG
jgi:D-glycero-D-manno-heptose 1,7-bisphosphate phosphatase